MLTKENRKDRIYLSNMYPCVYLYNNHVSQCVYSSLCVCVPSQCVSCTSLMPDGQSHTNPRGWSTQWWEQPPLFDSHSFSSETHTHTMHHGFHQISVRSLEEVDRSSGLGEWLRKWAGKWRRHIKAFPHRSSPRHCRPHSPRCDHTSTSDPHTVH